MVRPRTDPLVARKRHPPKQTAFRPPVEEKETGPVEALHEKDIKELAAKRAANGGWSETPPGPYKEYPLYTTKRALREGIRYHVMRFNGAKGDQAVDPTDQDQFPRPVSLHRRDPRAPPAGRVAVKEEPEPVNPVDNVEAERQLQLKADREAQRAIELAQIAPVKAAEPKPTKPHKKEKDISTYYPRNSEQAKKASGLRYEETLPWHLEDVEGKNVWVGTYVAALSEINVALVISGGGFRMIPLERYYKFNQKPIFQMMNLEQAEKLMKEDATQVGRWVMKDQERAELAKEYANTRQFLSGGAKVKVESSTSRALPKSERRDDHDIDMSGDEFQDDDENPGFEADDEDTRDTKDRVRRDHLGANLFGEAEEDEVEKEEKQAKLERQRDKVQGKSLRKALVKLDQNRAYEESDSDTDNPFQTSSSESDSEAENDKDKSDDKKDKSDDKKDEEGKKLADQKDKLAPGTNSKGNTTPSGKQKAPDMSKKVKSLKRPASPNVSESSGNESSRKPKKAKKNLQGASVNVSRSGTPMPGRPKGLGGAASDAEATAGEGSDAGLRKTKIKLKAGTGTNSTPVASRQGSPAPAPAG